VKIYIAGRFDDRDEIRQVRSVLEAVGHVVLSSWLDEVPRPAEIPQETHLRTVAVTDIAEVLQAEAFILYTKYSVGERGGRENEFGLIMYKPHVLKVVVGPLRTVFHRMCDKSFNTFEEFLKWFPSSGGSSIKECLEKANYGKEKKT